MYVLARRHPRRTGSAWREDGRAARVTRGSLAGPVRQVEIAKSIRHWSLTTLKEKLVKIGAKVVRHSRYVIFQLAEVSVPRQLFAAILGRIQQLAPAPT